MDSIKKKMQSLAKETTEAIERANKFEEEIRRTNDVRKKYSFRFKRSIFKCIS